MLPTGVQDSGAAQSSIVSASKSKKNKKRKNKNASSKANGEAALQNGNGHGPEHESVTPDQDNAGSDDELDSPQVEENHETPIAPVDVSETLSNGENGSLRDTSNGITVVEFTEPSITVEEHSKAKAVVDTESDTERRLEAAAKERDQLREEVTELRKSLEGIQHRHEASQKEHEQELASLHEKVVANEQKHVNEVASVNERLQDTQKRHEEELAGGDTRLVDTRRQHSEELAAVNRKLEDNQKHLVEETSRFSSSLEERRKQYEVEIKNLNAQLEQNEKRQEQEIAGSSGRLEAIQRQHDEKMNFMTERLEEDRKRHEEEVSKYSRDMDERRRQHEEEVAALNTRLQGSQKQQNEEAAGANIRFEEAQRQHQGEISAFDKKLKESQKRYDEEITTVNTTLQEIRKQHEEESTRLKARLKDTEQLHEEESSSLKSRLEDSERRHEEESKSFEVRLQDTEKRHEEELLGMNSRFVELQKKFDEDTSGSTTRLEEVQQRHQDELAALNTKLEESQTAKEHAETQYQKLLTKVNTIKTQLGERLKADAADLLQARGQIEELEEQNKTVSENNQALQVQVGELTAEKEQQAEELVNLRNRANLSQQNWVKERDDFFIREAQLKEEFESAKQAMQDWEVLAMEERSIREGLGDRVSELEEQLSNQREAFERAASERDTQSITVDGLQRALHDIQEARKVELREIVENTQTQLEDIRAQLKAAEELATSSQSALESTRQELEKALPFEKEVKEKNLLIGKLRHEAVILNDHLTKALRFLKKSKPEDTVDRLLVTNHLLQFLALDRSDPKKFQILQLISSLLSWTDEQNEAAGLARPGASAQPMNPNSSLRVPLSPFMRRVSSQTSIHPPMNLNSIFNTNTPLSPTAESGTESPGKESLAELWNGFLERESATKANSNEPPGMHSRQSSFGNGRRETLVSPTSGTSTPRHGGYSLRGSRSPSVSGGNPT